MIVRVAILVAVLLLALAVVWVLERRPVAGRTTLGPGIVLVTGEGCTLCPLAVDALSRTGVPHRVADVAEVAHLGIKSVPTLLAIGSDGRVAARRTGSAAVSQASRAAAWVS